MFFPCDYCSIYLVLVLGGGGTLVLGVGVLVK